MYCAAQGWQFEIIAALGSGMNYQKLGQIRSGLCKFVRAVLPKSAALWLWTYLVTQNFSNGVVRRYQKWKEVDYE